MMKLRLLISILLLSILLPSCNPFKTATERMDRAEDAINTAPEQALASLDSIRRTTLITAPRFDYVHDSIHSVPKRVFSFAMLRIQDNFGNLPLFISEVSWILTHNLN